ncbi:MAG TPA: hypothetical protein PK129_04600, partial [Cellvibrionaceae bacterium]|nr:hypothetical protein [Cellvibrionaceae bacterium]
QKSINALRTALTELAGEQEFVAYFSKRGYQLMQPVHWIEANNPTPAQPALPHAKSAAEAAPNADIAQMSTANAPPAELPPAPLGVAPLNQPEPAEVTTPRRLVPIGFGFILILITGGLGYWFSAGKPAHSGPQPQPVAKVQLGAAPTHKLPWQIISHYLPAQSNAHHTTPSPDSKRAAYVRDTEISGGAHQSDLMIRDAAGADWLLARSNSAWVDLTWSPSGRALAALELYRADGVLKDPDYYQSPQYLYNIHLFTLDLKGQHLLEKNLLSQWQGKVNSITWRDENTLEFVATMGTSLSKERYHYQVTDQTLTRLAPLASGFQPLLSRVRDKTTALISRLQDKTQVEFLDEQQQLQSKQSIPASINDLSWAADGSGVYGLDTHQNQIYFVPKQGEIFVSELPAPLNNAPTGTLSHLKMNGDGQSIFITASNNTAQLIQTSPQGLKQLAEVNNLIPASVAYSPKGEGIIYATHQNNQAQIWQLNGQSPELLYKTDGPLHSILWPAADYLLIKANNKIARYELGNQHWTILIDEAQDLTPLAYYADTQMLLAVKYINDVRNIWRINLHTHQQKQLTFGEVGTALNWNNTVLFQYANQAGLWQLNSQEPNHTAMGDQLPQHSQLLGTTNESAFFVTGGPCHESDIQQLDLMHNTINPYLKRQDSNVRSLGFSAHQGVLQLACAANSYMSYEIRKTD